MAGSEMLFACTKCHSRHKFEELSKEEQLCKECRRKNPLISCNYCKLEFHILKKIDGIPVCGKCAHNVKTYGKPKSCHYCLVKAAFKDKCCARCISSEKKYGAPVKCQGCSLICAFNKKDSQAKMQGKLLCLRCTLKFKKDRHKSQKPHRKESKYQHKSNEFSATKTVNPVLAPLKAENITKSLYKSRVDTLEPASRHSTAGKTENNNSIEHTFGDHMTELTSLREQMIQLKRTISQKEKIILEKDKKINEFQAEQWEKEKLLRSKTQTIQKQYEERIESLQLENAALRKQVKDLTKVKKTPKVEKVSSRIRLEAHKISMTPTGGRSPEHTTLKKEKHIEESNTEAEDTAQEDNVGDTKKDAEEPDTSQASESESDAENEAKSKTTNDMKQLQSFDEAQADEIKKLLNEEENNRSDSEDEDTMVKRDKTRKRKRKSKLKVEEDEEDADGEDEDQKETDKKKRKKVHKSKAIVSDHDESDDEETVSRKDDNKLSDGDESGGESPKLAIDEENKGGGSKSSSDDDDEDGEDDDEIGRTKKSDSESADSSNDE